MSRTFPTFAAADAYRNRLEATGQRVVVLGTDDVFWIVSIPDRPRRSVPVIIEALAFLTVPATAFVAIWVALPTGWIFA